MKKLNVIALHLAYWVLYHLFLSLMFVLIVRASGPIDPEDLSPITLVYYILGSTTGAVAFYGAYSLVFDRFLNKKRILMTVLASLATAFVGALAGDLGFTLARGTGALFADGMRSCIEITLTVTVLVGIPNVLLGLGMRAFVTWYADIQTKKALVARHQEMELALLKAQINPHFLFNTISNIDVLIEKDPAKASEYLRNLSDIMRFTLYETQADAIPLRKELDYIGRYIALQKIRFSKPDAVKWEVNGVPGEMQVAPMLFIPFIENAFKYGESMKSDPMIAVRFDLSPKEIRLSCQNRYQNLPQSDSSGLGNSLMRKRLELLHPGRFQLETQDRDGIYSTQLVISLP